MCCGRHILQNGIHSETAAVRVGTLQFDAAFCRTLNPYSQFWQNFALYIWNDKLISLNRVHEKLVRASRLCQRGLSLLATAVEHWSVNTPGASRNSSFFSVPAAPHRYRSHEAMLAILGASRYADNLTSLRSRRSYLSTAPRHPVIPSASRIANAAPRSANTAESAPRNCANAPYHIILRFPAHRAKLIISRPAGRN